MTSEMLVIIVIFITLFTDFNISDIPEFVWNDRQTIIT